MKRTILLLILLLALAVTACAPRIYGAKPHRRDRNCGCEVPQPAGSQPCDDVLASL